MEGGKGGAQVGVLWNQSAISFFAAGGCVSNSQQAASIGSQGLSSFIGQTGQVRFTSSALDTRELNPILPILYGGRNILAYDLVNLVEWDANGHAAKRNIPAGRVVPLFSPVLGENQLLVTASASNTQHAGSPDNTHSHAHTHTAPSSPLLLVFPHHRASRTATG